MVGKMRVVVATASLLFVVGCDRMSLPASAPAQPAKFELRDFRLTKVSNDLSVGLQQWAGRGTLTTSDERVKNGSYVLVLRGERVPPTTQPVTREVVMRDGVGTLETYDYAETKDGGTITYSSWAVLGYYRLDPASLVVDGAASAPH